MRSLALTFVATLTSAALAIATACCGSPPMPKGPAPEYEDPPAPSWLDAGTADAPVTTSPAPEAQDAGAI